MEPKEKDKNGYIYRRSLYIPYSGKYGFLAFKAQRKYVEQEVRFYLRELKAASDDEYYHALKKMIKELQKCCPKLEKDEETIMSAQKQDVLKKFRLPAPGEPFFSRFEDNKTTKSNLDSKEEDNKQNKRKGK